LTASGALWPTNGFQRGVFGGVGCGSVTQP
jgi:hypothetical protein